MTRRTEPFLFFNMTQRIEPCFKYDSKNCFSIKTQRIEPFLIWLKELSLSLIWRNALNFFLFLPQGIEPYSKYGSKNWICFSNVTRRIELFSLIWLTELNFFKYDSRKWATFFQRWLKGFFSKKKNSKNWMFFQYLTKNWLFYDSEDWIFLRRKELNPFSSNMTQRNWTLFLFEYDAKNWTTFFEYDPKNWTLFLFLWRTELSLFF